jgi:hypothetical protein
MRLKKKESKRILNQGLAFFYRRLTEILVLHIQPFKDKLSSTKFTKPLKSPNSVAEVARLILAFI